MRRSTLLVLVAVAVIVSPRTAYGLGGENGSSVAEPMAAPLDRPALVAEIASTWRGEISARGMDVAAWENDLRQALATRNDGQLLSLVKASSYESLVRQLGGLSVPGVASVKGSSTRTALTVGDFSADLVYVPIVPCRVFDTRFGSGAGKIAAGGTKAFYTNSPSAGSTTFLAQGGDASLCTQVPYDPVAVNITLTAVNEEATGFLTAWPYLSAYPNTSHLNWAPNIAVANTTSVLTCYLCGPDINVAVSAKTDVLGDIVGYFEQAVLPPAGRAYATVNAGGPSFVAARTKNFSAVTRPATGVFCLSTSADITNTPIIVTAEWGGSSGNILSAYVMTINVPFACAAGQVEVRTYNPDNTPANSVNFHVFIP